MAGRHHVLLDRLSSRHRLVIAVAVVLWLFVLVGLIAFLHEDRKAPLADPAPPVFPELSEPAEVPVLPAPTVTAPSPATASPRPSTRTATTAPPPRRTTAPPAPGQNFTARYVITNNQARSYQVGILLTNDSDTSRRWEMRVTHDPAAGVRFQAGFGASVTRSGDTTLLSGGPIAAGRTATIGFQVAKQVDGVVRPTGCVVDGRNCVVLVQ